MPLSFSHGIENKKYFWAVLLLMALALLIFLSPYERVTYAKTSDSDFTGLNIPPPFQGLSSKVNAKCEPEMQDFADKLLKDYRDFQELNFQNKSSTGSLMEPAMSKYKELQHNLYTAYYKYYPNEGAYIITTGTQPGSCLKIVETTLSDARTVLKKHALRTSSVKKSTALLEKYQAINAQLGTLHRQLLYTKAYLGTFATKLPCYVKKACVK